MSILKYFFLPCRITKVVGHKSKIEVGVASFSEDDKVSRKAYDKGASDEHGQLQPAYIFFVLSVHFSNERKTPF